MGRPINKRYFGPPTAGGNEIKVDFNDGSSVVEGYIVKQVASRRFKVAALGTPGTLYTCKLTTGKLPATLAAGEMSISVLGDDGETYNILKIAGRKAFIVAPTATGSNALDETSVPWNFTVSGVDGAVQVEEAGETDDAASATDDDFTEDA